MFGAYRWDQISRPKRPRLSTPFSATLVVESIRSNKKTQAYGLPRGQILYLPRSVPITLARDHRPAFAENVARSPAIEVLDAYHHGSNMREFPSQKLGGEREIPYGWRLRVSRAAALIPVLRKLDAAPLPGS